MLNVRKRIAPPLCARSEPGKDCRLVDSGGQPLNLYMFIVALATRRCAEVYMPGFILSSIHITFSDAKC